MEDIYIFIENDERSSCDGGNRGRSRRGSRITRQESIPIKKSGMGGGEEEEEEEGWGAWFSAGSVSVLETLGFGEGKGEKGEKEEKVEKESGRKGGGSVSSLTSFPTYSSSPAFCPAPSPLRTEGMGGRGGVGVDSPDSPSLLSSSPMVKRGLGKKKVSFDEY